MNKLLAIAGIVALLAACAEPPPRKTASDDPAFQGPGAVTAASLGFHGPVDRMYSRAQD